MSTPIATETVNPTEHVVPPKPEGATPEADPLGAPGLAALKSEREAKTAAEKRATDAEARIKEFEDRDKTAEQKRDEETEALRRENAELKSGKTRAEVAAAKGVPVGLISGATKEELEASADALIAFKGDPQPQRLHVPNEGLAPTGKDNPSDQFAGFLKEQLGQ